MLVYNVSMDIMSMKINALASAIVLEKDSRPLMESVLSVLWGVMFAMAILGARFV